MRTLVLTLMMSFFSNSAFGSNEPGAKRQRLEIEGAAEGNPTQNMRPRKKPRLNAPLPNSSSTLPNSWLLQRRAVSRVSKELKIKQSDLMDFSTVELGTVYNIKDWLGLKRTEQIEVINIGFNSGSQDEETSSEIYNLYAG